MLNNIKIIFASTRAKNKSLPFPIFQEIYEYFISILRSISEHLFPMIAIFHSCVVLRRTRSMLIINELASSSLLSISSFASSTFLALQKNLFRCSFSSFHSFSPCFIDQHSIDLLVGCGY